MRTTHWINTRHDVFIALVMGVTWLDFGEFLLETFYFGKVSLQISDVFFQGQTLFRPYLWNDWCETKGSALVEYWAQYVALAFDLTHDLDLGCFKVKLRSSSFSGIVGLVDVKWKRSELLWYWADCMTCPFMTMILTSVTMVGWADVPDSDWGDFIRRRAVDISS